MTQVVTLYRRSELEAVGDGCLYRYNQIWRKGVDDTSDLALVGIGLHKVQHRYILRLTEKQIPQDAEEARAAFTEGIAAARTPNRLIPDLRELWDRWSEHWELPLEEFLAAEERQETEGVTWAPDLVLARPTELEITDFKWGWTPPMTDEELRLNFQARVYSFYAMQRWPNFPQYRFTIAACRFNKYVSVVFTHSDLDNVERELQAHIATVQAAERSGSWPAVAGPSCRFCELACPLVDTPVKVPVRFLSPQQAEQVGVWVLAGDQVLKQAKKALKGYVASHGPVTINGMEFDNRMTVTRTYPAAHVITELEAVNAAGGLDPTDAKGLTISHSALKPFFKRFPILEDRLRGVAQEKVNWRFSAKRPSAGDEGEDE